MNEWMDEFTRRTSDKNSNERVQDLCGISYLCTAGVGAARVENRFRAKSRGHCMSCHENDWTYPEDNVDLWKGLSWGRQGHIYIFK